MEPSSQLPNVAHAALGAERLARYARASVTSETVTLGESGPRTTRVTLCNASGMEVSFLSRGGIVVSILVPDRDGILADVVLGYDDYAHYLDDRFYFGALVGRSANRIAHGRFSIDGREYSLSTNDGAHHLHGGVHGLSHQEWRIVPFKEQGIVGAELALESPAGDQGYPGKLGVRAKYTLTDTNEFLIEYRAETDQATPVNLTQHAYFNLIGCNACSVVDHLLTVHADAYTPVDAGLIPTGELRAVQDSAFDFRSAKRIGEHMGNADAQLELAGGYDHNFVIAGATPGGEQLVDAASLYDASSGRLLEIRTTKPGIQVYTGNELELAKAGKGGPYVRHAGVALETQHFPDAPNHDNFPSTILEPGQQYYSATSYQFRVVSGRAGT